MGTRAGGFSPLHPPFLVEGPLLARLLTPLRISNLHLLFLTVFDVIGCFDYFETLCCIIYELLVIKMIHQTIHSFMYSFQSHLRAPLPSFM